MRRPALLLASACLALAATSALTAPPVRAWLLDGLRVSSAAAQMDDHLPGLTIGGTDAPGTLPGMRGAAPLAAGLDALTADERTRDGVLADEAMSYLATFAAGTYIDEVLAASDSLVTRWPLRGDRRLTYWVQPGGDFPEWTPEHRRMVESAFAEWDHAGLPLHLVPTRDSTAADVVVAWRERFDEPISGKTRWTHDRRGWIRSARVTIAFHRSSGELLRPDETRAITLHEVGHALGLEHTTDVANVMAARVRVRTLSEADRATAQLLYRLPAGSLKQ
ncbi:MAG TPA: matrixin family metalloprotease [Gemmatimonadaceae bacterium]|nr:matrixin family metalloprotease [Gemmatimonadaceae bacterium]